jgi:hypothetical protein
MENDTEEPMKRYIGNTMYQKWKKGRKLSRKEAMDAHCAECMGFYADGAQDCKGISCPIYDWRPAASKDPNRAKKERLKLTST